MTQKKRRKNIILRICVLAFALYAAVLLIDMQVTLSQRQQDLDVLKAKYEAQRLANKEVERRLEAGVNEETVERIAREELGYVAEDDLVFYDISGN